MNTKTKTLSFFGAALALAVTGTLGQERVRSLMTIPGDAQVTLTWLPAAGASGYNVKRASSSFAPLTVVATNIPGTTCTLTNLKNGTNYYFAVSSVADEFESADTPRLRATPSAAVLDLLPAGAKLEQVATGYQVTEGPVWDPAGGGSLIFSDIDGNRMYRWTPGSGATTFRQPSNRANGNTLDRQGRLITCQQTTRSVTRTKLDGTVTTLVSQYKGQPFNEPNDVVVKSDGTVWFTDPIWSNATMTQPGQYVYRFDPEVGNASVTLVATNTLSPNGLCFSPDETRLYVADCTNVLSPGAVPGLIWVYNVLTDNSLTNGRVFVQAPYPDGIRADHYGRIYTRAFVGSGVGLQLFGADGQWLGALAVPEPPYNLCLGGTNQEMLFITAQISVYAVTRMPDLVVTAIYTIPASPREGQRVTFTALVKNQGTGSTPTGQVARLSFALDGATNVLWSEALPQAIPPDATVLVTVSAGTGPPLWTATAGSHSLQATVDDLNQLPESNDKNNTFTASVTVSAIPTDSDGDGMDDASETYAGTNSLDRDSVLRMTSIEPADADHLALTWSSVERKAYRVVRCASLEELGWASNINRIVAPGGATSLTQTVTNNHGLQFFRVQVVP